MVNYKNTNLFSFILDCYSEIDGSPYKEIAVLNNTWNFNDYIKENKFLSFEGFIEFLIRKNYISGLSNKRFLSFLLMFLDDEIYSFVEYDNIFIKKDDSELKNDKYLLIILPENSAAKQINKLFLEKSKSNYGLREARLFNPKATCNLLRLKHLNIIKLVDEFEIKQSFVYLPQISEKLRNNKISIGFFPFIKMDSNGRPLLNVNESQATFSLHYDAKYSERYIKYLLQSFKLDSSIILLPENSIPPAYTSAISHELNIENEDVNKIIVAGTLWSDSSNACLVFDDDGNQLVTQYKFNPYIRKTNNNFLFENLNIPKEKFLVNLLHVKSFGLFGFPICSDLLNAYYIESLFCKCKVTNLIVPCMSFSKDIFSSLGYLSSQYGITIFAVNSFIADDKLIGCCTFPSKYKKSSKRHHKEYWFYERKKQRMGEECKGKTITINLKDCTK